MEEILSNMEESDDKIFNNDPIYMKNLIGKKVQLKTIENILHTGIVYVIDPIYKTVVLHKNRRSEEDYETVFVLYHAIGSLNVVSEEVEKGYLKTNHTTPIVNSDGEKKTRLKKWFQHMYIEVSESGDYLKIDDHLLIVPPYERDNCISNNTIVLDRIQKIMDLMPPNFKPEADKEIPVVLLEK